MPRTPTPVAAEAVETTFIAFEHDGEAYKVQPTDSWSLDALEAFEDGRVVTTLRHILAPGEYARFRKDHSTVADLTGFVKSMQEALGISGNS